MASMTAGPMTAEHAEALHALGATAVPWATIFQWIMTYGLPLLLQLLPILLPLLKGGKFDLPTLIAYAEQVLEALQGGNPVPDPPTP